MFYKDSFQVDASKQEWGKMCSFPVPIMLGSGISINGRLFITGGVTGTLEKPRALSTIFTYNDET